MTNLYEVKVTAGDRRPGGGSGVTFTHRWTEGGVHYEGEFTGAHMLNLAVAGCILNDVYREAESMGVRVAGVEVIARGGFDDQWASTGIEYSVVVDSPEGAEAVTALIDQVDDVAEIPRAFRAGGVVRRVS